MREKEEKQRQWGEGREGRRGKWQWDERRWDRRGERARKGEK